MKIALFSDLHTEFFAEGSREPWMPDDHGCDVLVLAGDIVTEPAVLTEYVGAIRSKWDRVVPIVYVPGNHEYYGNEFYAARESYLHREIPAFHCLDRRYVEIDGVVFVGATLWTDFRRGADFGIARRGLNDYRKIWNAHTDSTFAPEDAANEHALSLAFIRKHVAAAAPYPVVVVSHHAPSFRSCSAFYNPQLDSCYASNLEAMIEETKPRLWIHGHIHESNDYTVGETRILTNPRGYDLSYDKSNINPKFRTDIVVEVEARKARVA